MIFVQGYHTYTYILLGQNKRYYTRIDSSRYPGAVAVADPELGQQGVGAGGSRFFFEMFP